MIKKGDQQAKGRERGDVYGSKGWQDRKGGNNVPLMQSQALAEGPAPICLSLHSACYTFFMNAERELATDCRCKSLLLGRGNNGERTRKLRVKEGVSSAETGRGEIEENRTG